MSEKAHLFAIGHPGDYAFYLAVTENLGVVECGAYASPKAARDMSRWYLRDKDVKVARKVTSMEPREFIKRLETRRDGDE